MPTNIDRAFNSDLFSVLTANWAILGHFDSQNPAVKKIRTESLDGRDYLVVPMVMLTEGVHNGSSGPIYYSQQELSLSPSQWNWKPIVIDHPFNGKSATDLEVYKKQAVGMVMNAVYEDGKLKAEAWLDVEKVKDKCPTIIEHIEHGLPMEVSTGLSNEIVLQGGEWRGEHYYGTVSAIKADHLAILPREQGACSLADGAGLLINKDHAPFTHNTFFLSGSNTQSDNYPPTQKQEQQQQTQQATTTPFIVPPPAQATQWYPPQKTSAIDTETITAIAAAVASAVMGTTQKQLPAPQPAQQQPAQLTPQQPAQPTVVPQIEDADEINKESDQDGEIINEIVGLVKTLIKQPTNNSLKSSLLGGAIEAVKYLLGKRSTENAAAIDAQETNVIQPPEIRELLDKAIGYIQQVNAINHTVEDTKSLTTEQRNKVAEIEKTIKELLARVPKYANPTGENSPIQNPQKPIKDELQLVASFLHEPNSLESSALLATLFSKANSFADFEEGMLGFLDKAYNDEPGYLQKFYEKFYGYMTNDWTRVVFQNPDGTIRKGIQSGDDLREIKQRNSRAFDSYFAKARGEWDAYSKGGRPYKKKELANVPDIVLPEITDSDLQDLRTLSRSIAEGAASVKRAKDLEYKKTE